MRNIFDQYSKKQLENRVTHAMAHALVSGSLLQGFLEWTTGYRIVKNPVIVVQDHAGDQEGIPDMTIGDDSEYMCAVENKLYPGTLNVEQLMRHWDRVRGVEEPGGSLLVVTPDEEEPMQVEEARQRGVQVFWRRWLEIYKWMRRKESVAQKTGPTLIKSFCEYLRQVENEIQAGGAAVMLTTFDGISFEDGKRDDVKARSYVRYLKRHIESSDAARQVFPDLSPEQVAE